MKILDHFNRSLSKKQIVLLIDPDKQTPENLRRTIITAEKAKLDAIFLGGSLVSSSIEDVVVIIKEFTSIPVILFPGSLLQITDKADAILLLSLISGRNPDFLIGNQVVAAPILHKSGLEIIPAGYMLVDCGTFSSVEYMSNTRPIPSEKDDIARATAMAGEMLGKKLIYLEGGSGAERTIRPAMIRSVKDVLNIPLIVGGGIRSCDDARKVCEAGADIIVVGTAAEDNPDVLNYLSEEVHRF